MSRKFTKPRSICPHCGSAATKNEGRYFTCLRCQKAYKKGSENDFDYPELDKFPISGGYQRKLPKGED